jgi:hypothetical protein
VPHAGHRLTWAKHGRGGVPTMGRSRFFDAGDEPVRPRIGSHGSSGRGSIFAHACRRSASPATSTPSEALQRLPQTDARAQQYARSPGRTPVHSRRPRLWATRGARAHLVGWGIAKLKFAFACLEFWPAVVRGACNACRMGDGMHIRQACGARAGPAPVRQWRTAGQEPAAHVAAGALHVPRRGANSGRGRERRRGERHPRLVSARAVPPHEPGRRIRHRRSPAGLCRACWRAARAVGRRRAMGEVAGW